MACKSIIFGASSGIGLAITKELLNHNQEVFGVSRRDMNLEIDLFRHLSLDVKDENLIKILKDSINLSEVNNLIYCVGTNKVKLAKDINKDEIELLFKTNLIPAILLSSEFAKSRKKSNLSSILFIGSIWSSFGIKGRSLYGTTKSALAGFTKHLSAELNSEGCLVNVLSPGFTDTPLTHKTINDPLIQKMLRRASQERMLNTSDISNQAKMLVRPFNTCITGQEIFIDGGFSSHA